MFLRLFFLDVKKSGITNLYSQATVNVFSKQDLSNNKEEDFSIKPYRMGPDLIYQTKSGVLLLLTANFVRTYTIHATAPVYKDGKHHEAEELYNCYIQSLNLVRDYDIRTILIPLISTKYGFPIKEAWYQALKACYTWGEMNKKQTIHITITADSDEEYELGKEMNKLFRHGKMK